MRPRQSTERARIETEARKLAHSGRHGGWRSIERALMSQGGFSELAYVFANKWTRFELDRLCLQAQINKSIERSATPTDKAGSDLARFKKGNGGSRECAAAISLKGLP